MIKMFEVSEVSKERNLRNFGIYNSMDSPSEIKTKKRTGAKSSISNVFYMDTMRVVVLRVMMC